MKNLRLLSASVALFAASALTSCSIWTTQSGFHGNPVTEKRNVAALTAAAPQSPGSFTAALTSEYAALAASLDREGDLADADYFARKGLAAAAGDQVLPEDNTSWAIPLEQPYGFRTRLALSRARLMTALDGGARTRAPALAARAQVNYDCWVERMEDDWPAAQNGACAANFAAAMDEIEGKKAATPRVTVNSLINVFFEFDGTRLTREGQQIVTQVANRMKTANLNATLLGKADLTGSDSYDIALGRRRADAVAAELERNGVPASRIAVQSVGKRQPPVKTAEGVREPRNRVVEITLH